VDDTANKSWLVTSHTSAHLSDVNQRSTAFNRFVNYSNWY